MMDVVMAVPAAASRPIRVRDLLVAALPELREHMLEETIRRDWQTVVGRDLWRRSRPGRLSKGALEVSVDNSPGLHELTLRSGMVLAALQAQHGSTVTALKFVLGPVPAHSSPEIPRRRSEPRPRLSSDESHSIDAMMAGVADPELAASLRRLVTKDVLSRRQHGRGVADPPDGEDS
jgi:hypothetical protein